MTQNDETRRNLRRARSSAGELDGLNNPNLPAPGPEIQIRFLTRKFGLSAALAKAVAEIHFETAKAVQ